MSKHTVFLVGSTGETGHSILEALIEDGSFDIICFIRTASSGKPAINRLKERGLKLVTGDLTGPSSDLVTLLQGVETVISAIFPLDIAQQIPLIDAAIQANVKRFVPCNWGTPAARGGIMVLRDLKEEVHDHIFRQRLGFTIIDVGYWYVASLPRVPSGRFDRAAFLPIQELYASGTAPNMLIDKKDVGRVAVKIIKDDRTLNKRVIAYGDVLCQNELHAIIEEKTGEFLNLPSISAEEIRNRLEEARQAVEADPTDVRSKYKLVGAEYANTKYVRHDNTPKNAEYLGYINARELYPDFEYISFADFVDELIAGKVERPYPHIQF